MIYNCTGYWNDDKGRRHEFSLQSDRSDRDFIRQLVDSLSSSWLVMAMKYDYDKITGKRKKKDD
ncbi:hypothetical protein [Synechococcus phage S-B43]|nr:hypothetical protein [Synechococcus phage S-B43]